MTRRSKTPDDEAEDDDLPTLQERMAARGMAMRHARTGGLLFEDGEGNALHFSDPCTALAASREPDPGKEFRTLQANLALVGWSLLADPPAGFVASRWNRAVNLADLAAVQSFAERVGVQP